MPKQSLSHLKIIDHSVPNRTHNLDIIREADCIVDLGPEGGEKGGRVVTWGPVGKVIRSRRSYIARYLKEHMSRH